MTTTPRSRRSPGDGAEEAVDPSGPLPPPPVPGLRPDRSRLLRERVLREAGAAEPPRTAAGTRMPHRTRFLVPALACALVIGGAVAADLADTAPPGAGTAARTPAGGPASVPDAPAAARLLGRVALAAADQERLALRPDQFVYVESKAAHAAGSAAGGPVTLAPVRTRQVWLSADGSRPGLLRRAGERDTVLRNEGPVQLLEGPGATPRPFTPRPAGPSAADPTPLYVASLPTDPVALLRLIRDETGGQGQDPDQRAFTAIGELLAENWAPPRVGAALYRAAALIPGVTVVDEATDAVGREGVAVARTAHGRQTQWIFDRTTHAFLGERSVLAGPGAEGPAGTVVGTSAILTKAAVDRPGEIPRTPDGTPPSPR